MCSSGILSSHATVYRNQPCLYTHINYLCTCDLYSPVHNVLDGCTYITWHVLSLPRVGRLTVLSRASIPRYCVPLLTCSYHQEHVESRIHNFDVSLLMGSCSTCSPAYASCSHKSSVSVVMAYPCGRAHLSHCNPFLVS
jgi:hypothetical protein